MSTTLTLTGSFERDGFAIVEDVLSAHALSSLAGACDKIAANAQSKGQHGWGVRNLLDWPAIKTLALSEPLQDIVESALGTQGRVTRGILFDKTSAANWGVLWHQDLTLAVAERMELPGWGPWTRKGGVQHVQPPASILQQMVTLRVHLDDCRVENGALRVVPGSHALGRLKASEAAAGVDALNTRTLAVRAGDVVVMRPLLVHSSSSATKPARRRVIHLEYIAPSVLAGGVRLCDA